MLLLYPSKEEARRIRNRIAVNKYQNNHPQKKKDIFKNWYIKNREQNIKDRIKRYKENPLQYKKCKQKYSKSKKGKLMKLKSEDIRKRELGSELLNDWFEGCNRHHINAQQIVCIPAELHKAHPHNHKKPETMEVINRIAMQYLFNCKM